MFDYLRYYLSPLLQLVAAAGIIVGGPYVWVGIASLPAMAILDSLLPVDLKERKINNRSLANIPIWISSVAGPCLFFILAWKIGTGSLSGFEMFGATISVAWLSVIVVVPAAHELYHQRGAMRQLIGTYCQVVYLDCTRNIAHMSGHHLDVGTALDSDTAARGATLYNFALPAVYHSTICAFRLESDALEKRGMSRLSIKHRMWPAIFAQLIFQAIIFLIGGLPALLCTVGAVLLSRLWVETFNYFQHYGQVRVPGKPIGRRHVWNHLGPITRVVAFEITNHADHHLNAYTPYYKLKPDTTAIVMPNVFICFLSALVPPIWNNVIIKPALKRWDLEFASSEERELAKVQNEKAGWPNWFEGAEVAGGKVAA
ncbi:alkane 1-monooxygenase [Spongiibacter sp. UBA1325]|jgi:fatty acid desaturase|uniref:alkane 1-monooxygenase n=1 Tax=Spongiibacter sp. UBA1325 TaxID=1947543 RepID=UPI00257C141D|nr:alkane 1-monooxygenase [Spongiibacter sp. UBA1325]|tara:strand:+ start:6914 stop:8026 length:1113 start_codon:yes stop_codon:yes gene_type:complete